MQKLAIKLAAFGCVLSTQVVAVTVDQATFKRYGGNLANIAGDIQEGVYNELRAHSYSRPWQSVGLIVAGKSWCTAVWIGEEGNWSYLLTAAHCIPYKSTATPVSLSFIGYDTSTIAEGAGTAYVPKDRFDKPEYHASTDIAIVKLPRRKTPVDDIGVAMEKPIFNDSFNEVGKTSLYIGYGEWGAGYDTSAAYKAKFGSSRMYGRSMVDNVFELERLLDADFDPYGPSVHWAATRSGDSGSAWWQFQNGKPTMVAVNSLGSTFSNSGTRISKYIKWIKAIYPGARLLSQEKPKGCIVLSGPLNISSRRSYCLQAGENSGYSLPKWVYGKKVDIQADSGVTVTLSDVDNLAYNRVASFNGTVENASLQRVKAANGQFLDFSRPRSMRVEAVSGKPLGCVISLVSAEKYCLSLGDTAAMRRLPAWIKGHDIFVQADPGVSVALYNEKNRGVAFSGLTQNHQLQRVRWSEGVYIDLSRPASISVIKQP